MLHHYIRRLLRQTGLAGQSAARPPSAQQVAAARQHIRDYWPLLTRHLTRDDDSLIGLPEPYLVASYAPGHEFDFNELYYWDTYMMAQGFIGDGDPAHQLLVEGMLEDLLHMVKRFGMVPNASRTYLTSRSQPPFLSRFILQVYHAYGKDTEWLKPRMVLAQTEYQSVWMGTAKPHTRQVYQGLSRNYSIDLTHDQAETESGWDYTPRFQRRCLDYLPVDLNALLYAYETDFVEMAGLLDDQTGVKHWRRAARKRRRTISKLMWDRRRGMFYDYDYKHRRRGPISSLAAYYCLWSGLATRQQAKAMVRNLRRFEHDGGLTATDDIPLQQRLAGGMPTQWAYPNGWAPLHLLTIQGLERYGYHKEARRIASKWLHTNLAWFEAHGNFLEKYNVVEPGQPPAPGVYPSQTGFGWTNAIFERLCREYVDRPRGRK